MQSTQRRKVEGRARVVGAVAVVVVALLATSCVFGGSATVRINGQEILDPERSLAEALRIVQLEATEVPANFAEDARCYFVRANAGGADDYRAEALCGPVLFVGDEPGSPWAAVELSLVSQQVANGRSVTVAQPEGVAATGVSVGNLDELWRPDGARPPSDVSLEAPQALPVSAGFLEVGTESALGVRLENEEWRIDGPSYSLLVTGVARPSTVETLEGPRRSPDGEEFVVLRTRLEPRPQPLVYPSTGSFPGGFNSGFDGDTTEQVSVSLDRGTSRKTLDAYSAASEQTIAFTVKDGEDAQLVLRDGQLEQGLDVLTGELVDLGEGIPEVLYREVVENDIARQAELPFTVISTFLDEGSEIFDFGRYPFSITVRSARLAYLGDGTPPSSPDKAWLVFALEVTGGNTWGPASPIPASGLVLTLPDGTQLTATVWGGTEEGNLFPDAWGFEVPASFTSGQLVVTPGPTPYPADFGPGRLSFRDAQASWDITIPES